LDYKERRIPTAYCAYGSGKVSAVACIKETTRTALEDEPMNHSKAAEGQMVKKPQGQSRIDTEKRVSTSPRPS
jgi:hypothetical protein